LPLDRNPDRTGAFLVRLGDFRISSSSSAAEGGGGTAAVVDFLSLLVPLFFLLLDFFFFFLVGVEVLPIGASPPPSWSIS